MDCILEDPFLSFEACLVKRLPTAPMTEEHYFRLRCIEKLLQRAPEAAYSKNEILKLVNEKLRHEGYGQIAERTLSNDFKKLTELGAEIGKSRIESPAGSGKKYHTVRHYTSINTSVVDESLNEQQLTVLKDVYEELEKVSGNPFIDEFRVLIAQRLDEHVDEGAGNEMLVHFDSREGYAGKRYIKAFFEAVKKKVAVKFQYAKSFEELQEVVLSPYLLKQYNHRWYCIGRSEAEPDMLSNIALDRVASDLTECAGFVPSNMEPADWNDRFQEIVGVTYNQESPLVDVHLRFHGKSRGYVYSKPMSICQRPLSPVDLENDPMDVWLEGIRVNFELKQQIMFYADQVEVVEPKELRRELEAMFLKGAKLNQT